MGVRIQAAAQDRPRITSVVGGSPAEAAGLARGDVLLTVGGRSVTMDTLTRELNRHALGDAVSVTLGRGGQEIETRLIPIENPLERWTIEELPGAGPAEEMLREAWLAGG
jgi:predicted metalloprotease with PDZ domain